MLFKGDDAHQVGGVAVGQNGTQGVLRNINSLAQQQLYQLSQVEAILRNHGTEIKVQAGRGGANNNTSSTGNGLSQSQQKQTQQQPVVQTSQASLQSLTSDQQRLINLLQENGSTNGDYFPMYGVEAVLDDADSGPSAK